MPYNGSGVFSIVNSFTPDTTISSSDMNANFTDIATGLSDVLTRDGQAGMTAQFQVINGNSSVPAVAFASDPTTGIYRVSSGIVGISGGLSVSGNVNISGSLGLTGTLGLTVGADKLLGNPTGSPATLSEITLAGNLSFSGSALKGITTPFTIQRFTSGSGTYTTPANCTAIRIRLVAGGGGGGGGGSGATSGSAGNATTFGGILTASGGDLGNSSNGTPGAGGAATGGNILNVTGSGGTIAANNNTGGTFVFGGTGGSSAFGGAGRGGANASGFNGTAGATNSGGGGGGAGCNNTANSSGPGGGAGGYIEHYISSPAATYAYAVGAAANGGNAGTGGGAGGAGAAGIIVVEEYY
jgi:hypothetical protein